MKKYLLFSILFFTHYAPLISSQKIVLSGNSSSSSIQHQISKKVSLLGTTNLSFGSPYYPGFAFSNAITSGCSDGTNLSITGLQSPASNDLVSSIVIQPDGKIIVAGFSMDSNEYNHFALARFLPDGTLDFSFGQTNSTTISLIPGTVFIKNFIAGGTNDQITSIALDSNGNIVVGGFSGDTKVFAVARFLPNGILDSSFGKTIPAGNGAMSTIPGTAYLNSSIAGGTSETPTSVIIDSNNNIILGGSSDGRFALSKFLGSGINAGALDPNFMGDNTTATGIPGPGTVFISESITNAGPDILAALALDHNETIVAVGNSQVTGATLVAVARFLPNGILDTSFSQGNPGSGETSVTIIPGTVFINGTIIGGYESNGEDFPSCVAIDSNNNIVVGVQSAPPAPVSLFALARFLPTGALDSSFFGDGITTITSNPEGRPLVGTLYINGLIGDVNISYLQALALDSEGRIVTAGYSHSDTTNFFALARFTPSGPLDSSFSQGASGATTSFIPGTFCVPNPIGGGTSNTNEAYGIGFQSDGTVTIGGYANDTNGNHFATARFFSSGEQSGTFDGSFGAQTQGTLTQTPGGTFITAIIPSEINAGINSIAFQLDGSMLVAFSVVDEAGNTHAGLSRLLPSGQPDNSFGSLATTASGITNPTPGTVYLTNSVAGGLYDQVVAVALQADGKIVLLTQSLDSHGTTRCGIIRFLSNGLLDSSFGTTNQTVTSLQQGTVYLTNGIAGSNDLMATLFITQNGNLLVGGSSFDSSAISHCSVARFLPEGTLDTTFGVSSSTTTSSTAGTVYITSTIIPNGNDRMNALAASSSSIFLGGYSVDQGGIQHFSVAQFSAGGELVSSFGKNTSTTANFIPGTVFLPLTISGGNWDQIKTIALQSNGCLVAAGLTGNAVSLSDRTSNCAFARFTTTGTLDATFGKTTPYLTSDFAGTLYITNSIASGRVDQINALVIDPSGTIMAAGYSAYTDHTLRACMVGLQQNGTLNPAFGEMNNTVTHVAPGVFYMPLIPEETSRTFNSLHLQPNGTLTVAGRINATGPSIAGLHYPIIQSFYTPITFANYVKTYGSNAGLNC